MYVLAYMVVTFPTCQVDRSLLKSPASKNTAPPQQRKESNDKNGLEKKEERALFKNRISVATERRREIEAAKKHTNQGEGKKESTY